MNIPITRWTVGLFLTFVAWACAAHLARTHGGGDYNFAPAIIGILFLALVVGLWVGLAMSWVLG
jgi:hypothetical protein